MTAAILTPDLGQWVGIVLLLAAATVVAIWGTRRTGRATTAAWDADVDRALAIVDPDALPVHDAAVEAIRRRARAVAAGEIGIVP